MPSYQHSLLSKPWSQQQRHLGRCQNKHELPATCTSCWCFCVCHGPWGWKGSVFSLHSSSMYQALDLVFFVQGSLQGTATWRAIFKCPLFRKVWSPPERTGCEMYRGWKPCVGYGSCMCTVMVHTCTFIFLCSFSSCGCACECPQLRSGWGACLWVYSKGSRFLCQLYCSWLEQQLWEAVWGFLITQSLPLDLQGAAKIRNSWMM